MATTRLMPLHTGKGRTVGQAISDIIDYTENPQKTDGGRLITSWQCVNVFVDVISSLPALHSRLRVAIAAKELPDSFVTPTTVNRE